MEIRKVHGRSHAARMLAGKIARGGMSFKRKVKNARSTREMVQINRPNRERNRHGDAGWWGL
jgi:hypothetical protein